MHQGLLPLVDPDFRPTVTGDRAVDGAVVTVDDELLLPPVNDAQRQILRRVDTCAQTLQGPGTGKTHTAAALLSHLLCKANGAGHRPDRSGAQRGAEKLPDQLPLSAVVGTSRRHGAPPGGGGTIGSAADEYDPGCPRHHRPLLSKIDRPRRRTLPDAATSQRRPVHPHAEGTRTPARIAETHPRPGGTVDAELVDPDYRPAL